MMECAARRHLSFQFASIACRVAALATFLASTASAQRNLAATRELTIGGTTANLSWVADLAVSPHGVIAVTQPQDHLVQFFDAAGTALGSFGRAGEGPGEFRSMHGFLAWLGDTLWLTELNERRVTVVGPNRKLVVARTLDEERMFDPRERLFLPAVYSSNPLGIDRTGALVVGSLNPGSAVPRWLKLADRNDSFFLRTDSSGVITRFVAEWPEAPGLPSCQKVIGTSQVLIPFCNSEHVQVAADGGLIAFTVPLPVPGKYRVIAVRGTTGDTVVDRVLAYLPIRIPRHVADSVRARVVAGSLSPELRAGYQAMDFPSFYQPVSRIVIGGDGSLWIAHVTGDVANHLWTVLDAHGAELGELRLPANVRVLAVQGDRFWGTVADADGLESVVRYRVH